MYPTQQTIQYRPQQYTQQPIQIQSSNPRSSWLIGFGITEVIFSKILLVWCVYWTSYLPDIAVATSFGAVCALFHIVVGILAIIGGRDGLRYRKCIVALLVLSIIGSAIFVNVTMAPLLITWSENVANCRYCGGEIEYKLSFEECERICNITDPAIVFSPFLILILLECIVGIILSGISCCRLCGCCGCCYAGNADTPTLAFQVFQSPQTPYYHLREDDIQHALPRHPVNYMQQNVT